MILLTSMVESGAHSTRPIPSRVGRYDVLVPIARGGMATVYLARSQGARGFARDVALKLTHMHLADEIRISPPSCSRRRGSPRASDTATSSPSSTWARTPSACSS